MKHADAHERSSHFNASAPYVPRRDPPKVGGYLGADANVEDVCSIKNLANFKLTALYVAKAICSAVIFMP